MSAAGSLTSCHCCGLIQLAQQVDARQMLVCQRCHTRLAPPHHLRTGNTPAAAIAATAGVLYLPAILLPFLKIEQLGQMTESSLLGGVASLFEHEQYLVGLIVVLFSILFPPFKLGAILLLSIAPHWLGHRYRAMTYRFVEQVGRWGMLDVLFVAVLIAFVKLGDLVHFNAGPGLYVFSAFVLLSLVASVVFDPHSLWEQAEMSESAAEPGFSSTPGNDPGPMAAGPVGTPPAATAIGTAAKTKGPLGKVPTAMARTKPPTRWLWGLLPALAVVFALTAIWKSWSETGTLITIRVSQGLGLKPGDSLRHRGIDAGRVEGVVLTDKLGGVEIRVRLAPEADGLAVQGSRFWVVRPQLDLSGVTGLETVVGAKYLEVLPGPRDGKPTTSFVGLEQPPLEDLLVEGGIEIVLQAAFAPGMKPGTPVYYRQLRVGGITQVGLASDASAVEARAYIRPEYRTLIRRDTRFWDASGLRLQGSLTGFSLQIQPLETLLRAGVSLAVPPEPGPEVEQGHRFELHDAAQSEWLTWRPSLAGAHATKLERPQPIRAVLNWNEWRLVFSGAQERTGWVLPIAGGLLGPTDLLMLPPKAQDGTTLLTIAGQLVPLLGTAEPRGELAFLPAKLEADQAALWPDNRFRRANIPEDVVLVAEPTREPLFISAARLKVEGNRWLLDAGAGVDASWHGAPAVAVSDGMVLGLVVVQAGKATLVPAQ